MYQLKNQLQTKMVTIAELCSYYTKFEPVIMNKEYIKYKDKHEKHAEVKMISQIGNLLSKAGFGEDNIEIQGGKGKEIKLIPIC